MTKHTNQPQEFDAVLGGQAPPPTSSVILGGIEGLRRRFATLTGEQKTSTLADALQYGEAGIDLLVEALNDEAFTVRATAYKLLHELTSIKAKQAVNNGILLKKGDKVYCVYSSAISYGDDWFYIGDYITDSNQEELETDAYYEDEKPKLISRHLFQEDAELEAKILHQRRMLEVDFSTLYVNNYNLNFNIQKWCGLNQVSLDNFPEYEEPWELENQVLKMEVSKKCHV
ncbi:hypothetical protein [Tolypothrix bouteillei]|uniref:Uncharacterized protein n=1 Tax=Tolypothrix bouteillei VB521301 TaxID=1479485 RepID=A0A8S9T5J8_9CYAN|nr:hypothetical protein [Tolypothrix bouteillei]KAF3887730.1 hypothetical protein DA73_0400021205 [Tolypothrix bouteillei VB521301]